MKSLEITILILICLVSSAYIFAKEDAVIEEINSVYEVCKGIETSKSVRKISVVKVILEETFGDFLVSDWMEYKPEFKDKVFEEAILFISQKRLTSAHIFNQTSSGDWFKSTEYYFRENGSLAFVFCNLATFHGNVRIETRLYFNPKGNQVKELKLFFDPANGKPINPDEDSFLDNPPEIFLTDKQLLEELKYEIKI